MPQRQNPPAGTSPPHRSPDGEPLSPILKCQEQQPSVKQCAPGRACLLQTRDRLLFHMPTIFLCSAHAIAANENGSVECGAVSRSWEMNCYQSCQRSKTQDDSRLRVDSEWNTQPATISFSPQTSSHLPRQGSHEEDLHCAESMTSHFRLALPCTCLPIPLELDKQRCHPRSGFPSMVAMAQACSLHEQDLFLFQPATLGKEEGKSLATAQAETQHYSPGEHRLSSPTYPISWWSGPTGSPGARHCGKLCTAFLIATVCAFPTMAEAQGPPESPSKSKLSRNSFIQPRPGTSHKPEFSGCSRMNKHSTVSTAVPTWDLRTPAWTTALEREEKKSWL